MVRCMNAPSQEINFCWAARFRRGAARIKSRPVARWSHQRVTRAMRNPAERTKRDHGVLSHPAGLCRSTPLDGPIGKGDPSALSGVPTIARRDLASCVGPGFGISAR